MWGLRLSLLGLLDLRAQACRLDEMLLLGEDRDELVIRVVDVLDPCVLGLSDGVLGLHAALKCAHVHWGHFGREMRLLNGIYLLVRVLKKVVTHLLDQAWIMLRCEM